MFKNSFFIFVVSTIVVPSAFAASQAQDTQMAGAGGAAASCVEATFSDLVSVELTKVTPWLDAILTNLNSKTRLSNGDLVNQALEGSFGTSPLEVLRSLGEYVRVMELRLTNDASVNGKIIDEAKKQDLISNVRLLNDTQGRIEKVSDAFNGFIDAQRHRPKNEKDQLAYDKKLDAKASDVLKVVYTQFDLAKSRSTFLVNSFVNIMKLEKPAAGK